MSSEVSKGGETVIRFVLGRGKSRGGGDWATSLKKNAYRRSSEGGGCEHSGGKKVEGGEQGSTGLT